MAGENGADEVAQQQAAIRARIASLLSMLPQPPLDVADDAALALVVQRIQDLEREIAELRDEIRRLEESRAAPRQ